MQTASISTERSEHIPHGWGRFFPDSLATMFAAALAIRLIASVFAYSILLDPSRDNWEFGWETGRVAHSLALGHGFASPWPGTDGPTATVAPVYPLILAGMFRIFGSFSPASAFAILAFNSLFSALTVFPVHRLAIRIFDRKTARWAGWVWVLYPYATYFAATRVWETCLTTLLFSLVVLMTYRAADGGSQAPGQRRLRPIQLWAVYGALWALTACTSPVTLSALPFMLGWIAYQTRERRSDSFFKGASIFLLVFVALASPWIVR